MKRILGTLLLAAWLAGCGPAETPAPTATPASSALLAAYDFDTERERLLRELEAFGIQETAILDLIRRVPRHEFVPADYVDRAYDNRPLPIGYGQTISQPLIVALMTRELGVEPGDRVLEIGTGSGYQAAVLAEFGVEVYSIEIIGPLADQAAVRLERLGYPVQLRLADGYFGWPEAAPFDAIIVTAAPDHVPQPLVQQLKVGGIMVLPIGPPGGYQELWKVTRVSEDQVETVSLGGVRFVPLTRETGATPPP